MGHVIFKLLDKKVDPSSFFQNADGTQDTDRKLDYTNTYGILNPFYVIEEDGSRTVYRHITGCGFFDVARQDKEKFVFNRANGTINFTLGADIVLDEKLGATLIKFLKMHPMNEKGEFHDKERHEVAFTTFDPQEAVKKEIDQADESDIALGFLLELKKNVEKRRAIGQLFKETASMAGDDEIYLGLRQIALKQPELFNSSIASREKNVLSDVLIAGKLNVIGKDAKAFFYEGDNTILFPCITKKRADAEAELVTFLMSKEGDIHYRNILVKVKQKEIGLNAPSGFDEKEKDAEDADKKE